MSDQSKAPLADPRVILAYIEDHLDQRPAVKVPLPTDPRYPMGAVWLPLDLTRNEADRICAAIQAWCPDDPRPSDGKVGSTDG